MTKLPEEVLKRIEADAEQYADSCDNESGAFLSRDLKSIRKKAAIIARIAEAERAMELVKILEMVDCIKFDVFSDKGKCLKCDALERYRAGGKQTDGGGE